MFFVLVGVGGVFFVDVLVVMVEGNFIVLVIVIDEVNNSIIDNEVGVVDILVFIFIIDVVDIINDVMLFIIGIIDEFVGVVVIILVMDSVGVI